MITKKDKKELLDILKKIDLKQMTIDHPDPRAKKWFRFGNYNALQIVAEIIKQLPERKKAKKDEVSVS